MTEPIKASDILTPRQVHDWTFTERRHPLRRAYCYDADEVEEFMERVERTLEALRPFIRQAIESKEE